MSTPALRFIEVDFRSSELAPNWYNGNQNIYLLKFFECNIKKIKTKAFGSSAFDELMYLGFFNNKDFIEFENNAFYGMPHLESFTLSCMWFGALDPTITMGFENSLHTIEFSGFSQRVSIQDLLKSRQLDQLYTLQIVNNYDILALAPGNFTALPNIITLDVSDSSIAIIFDGTFDVIAKSLRFLHLCQTNLLRIKPALLYTFLFSRESFHVSVPIKFRNEKGLYIHMNAIKCDCDYHFLKHLVLVTFGIVRGLNSVRTQVLGCIEPQADGLRACNLQPIHWRNICLGSTVLGLIAYPRFQINAFKHENVGRVQITENVNDTFRILFIPFEQKMPTGQKCFKRRWLRDNTKCYVMRNNASNSIQFNIDPERFMFISVVFVTAKRIWPLHLITIPPLRLSNEHSAGGNLKMIIFGTIVCEIGFLIGILIIIYLDRRGKMNYLQLKGRPRHNLNTVSLRVEHSRERCNSFSTLNLKHFKFKPTFLFINSADMKSWKQYDTRAVSYK